MSQLKFDQLPKPNFPELEEKVLEHWDEVNAFKRSISERPEDKPYVFYDGPPFATGLPHYGHLLGSVMKDIVPRYWTMKGYRVDRVWGWDCHGLPIENIVEKDLDLKGGKKGIEDLGIDKFNAACRSAIWRFDKEWEKIIRRIGRWVDMKNSYKTMDTGYMESVWWAFKELYAKDLVYQGRKVILYCPRCSTPLSNFEIAMDNSYQDVEDYSVFVKFKLVDKPNTYLIAWTTTPWTLMGNVGLAVDPQATYVKVKQADEYFILAESKLSIIPGDYETIETFPGQQLESIAYEPLYPYLDIGDKRAFYVMSASFVSLEEGSGIVHTAAMYGEDDYQLALKYNLPLVDMLDDQGKFMDFVTPLSGQFYKKTEDWIVSDLEKRGQMLAKSRFTHSYPFCYRCGTPLYYNAVPAWFIDIQKIKPDLVQNNEAINWFPDHLKHGRFGNGLETAPDWNISRSRYWGTPMPVWIGEKTGIMRVIGSREELKKWSVDPLKDTELTDLHREHIDHIKVWVDDNKSEIGKRVSEVFDCWVESGSMSFASVGYPFENKEQFEDRFPAQYIVEYVAQTRAWFYTLHVMSTALFGTHAFENAVTTGTIMAEDGTKMSKSKKNFPDPIKLVDRYGVDSLRLYFASSPVMKTAQNVNFSEEAVNDIRKKVFNIFWNVFSFYRLYDDGSGKVGFVEDPADVLDKWLQSITEKLHRKVVTAMDNYDVVTASRALIDYVSDLSTWYLRRSRNRLRDNDSNRESLQIFRTALLRWTYLAAPFAPFFTELIYQNLAVKPQDSLHLVLLPAGNSAHIHPDLEEKMQNIRKAIELGHAQRQKSGIKVRQPLAQVTITSPLKAPKQNLQDVIAEELNVKQVVWETGLELSVDLDTTLSDMLQKEGEARDLIRQVQNARKQAGLTVGQLIDVTLPQWPVEFETEIKAKVGAISLSQGEKLEIKLHS
jgi:isoleucyl-tRNA synthetase